ncbi:MAG: nucleotidyltransferase domain-containing protein [Candidatus Pacearchaeota archaeon]
MKVDLKKIVEKISKNKKVFAVYLFGSHAKRRISPLSDIDICIIGNLNNSEKMKILSLFSENYDVSFFEDLPIWIQIRVFREGKQLFVRDFKKIYPIVFEKIKEYEDFKPLLLNRIFRRFGKCTN